MDFTSLEIFEAVASELSITKAAALLGRAQSNVTTRVQALEQQVGAALFVREGKRLRLTSQGVVFLSYSRRIRALADEAIQVMHPAEPQGQLRLGTMESTAAIRLPTVLRDFHRTWPGVSLTVETGTSQWLIDRVARADMDCALVAILDDANESPTDFLLNEGLSGVKVYDETLVLLAPKGFDPAVPGGVSLAAFPKGCTYRRLAQEWLAANTHSAPFLIHEVSSYHAMFACLAAGRTACIVPEGLLSLQPAPENVVSHKVAIVSTWLVHRRGFNTAAFDAFMQQIQDQ
ncbi:LysR substrate-binding domain-containing protein [Pseudomonas sp. zjy_14]|uniref:LysR substrate-binding domain-containing protein n=1 Tax=Pseudomonas sp. zjy_14 TaxID=3367264 RepID=UPI003709CA5C